MTLKRDQFNLNDMVEIHWGQYKAIFRIVKIFPGYMILVILFANDEYNRDDSIADGYEDSDGTTIVNFNHDYDSIKSIQKL